MKTTIINCDICRKDFKEPAIPNNIRLNTQYSYLIAAESSPDHRFGLRIDDLCDRCAAKIIKSVQTIKEKGGEK